MPTYEYKCDACGNEFEKFQSITAAPIKKCPKCGKNKVRRLISSGGGMIFKGSGFYITDYRDQGYKDKAKAESNTSSEGKSETKVEGGKDTKTETKSPATETAAKPAESKSTPAAPKAEPKASKSARKK
jgi:putative FmdB family regulatory protein